MGCSLWGCKELDTIERQTLLNTTIIYQLGLTPLPGTFSPLMSLRRYLGTRSPFPQLPSCPQLFCPKYKNRNPRALYSKDECAGRPGFLHLGTADSWALYYGNGPGPCSLCGSSLALPPDASSRTPSCDDTNLPPYNINLTPGVQSPWGLHYTEVQLRGV